MMKVFVSAYACEPGKGSEPGVGWNWVKQIARFHEVWVITRLNNRGSIERALAKKPMPNVHWIYFDLPFWTRFWKRGQYGVHLYYYFWQIGIYFVAKRLNKEVRFDVIHHVTFGNYYIPSFLGLLPFPFVWGPVGGGESAPPGFWRSFGLQGRTLEIFRDLGRTFTTIDPITRYVARKASLAIAATEQTATRLVRLGTRKVVVWPQVGMNNEQIRYFSTFRIQNPLPFRIISIGRLIHWKGFHLSLEAFARFQKIYPDTEYWFVNDGPEVVKLKKIAGNLITQNKVVFWGKLPALKDVYEKLNQCHVLVHPALHEAFGNVCLEAMAAGRPVICLDLGGPAIQVTKGTGFKVSAVTPEQVVNDLASAMLKLAQDSELRIRMGEAGRKRVAEHFSWDKKGEMISQVYKEIVSKNTKSTDIPVIASEASAQHPPDNAADQPRTLAENGGSAVSGGEAI
ncbi:MAG: hypothetical protein A3A81_02165 [Omnitrophica bacterium RIFCSPLOWO2_01_FULL_45_10b]|nr:MAG: hypothetical protein A3A81_02165 [Omnitrophica bacterium RIFCSPLOWO2_01_FULL_45_10b]